MFSQKFFKFTKRWMVGYVKVSYLSAPAHTFFYDFTANFVFK